MTGRRGAGLAVGVGVGLLTAAFVAPSVQAAPPPGTVELVGKRLNYTAVDGEANVVTVRSTGQDVSLTDPGAGAGPTAGAGCRAGGPDEVVCTPDDPEDSVLLEIATGDLDDSIGVPDSGETLLGTLLGEEGADVLRSGSSPLTLLGGSGPDVFEGGDSRGDTVSYVDHVGPVVADIGGASTATRRTAAATSSPARSRTSSEDPRATSSRGTTATTTCPVVAATT